MIELRLPFPPSTNNLFITRGRKRVISPVYRTWREQALWELGAQIKNIKDELPIPYRAILHISLDESEGGDWDNRIKAVQDALVKAGVLRGDQKKYVKGGGAFWESVTGCRVRIEPA